MRWWLGAAALMLLACASERDDVTAPPMGTATTVAGGAATVTTAPAIRSVAMVGDSITNGSEDALREQLATLDVDVQVDAEDGRRMTSGESVSSGLEAVTTIAATAEPDLWVIALGTNDIHAYDGPEGYAPVISELIAAVPEDAPLVWVDVYRESSPDSSAEFNETLREVLGARPEATVVDWASLADEDGVLRDGVHPSGFGIEQFAELVTAAVAEWTS